MPSAKKLKIHVLSSYAGFSNTNSSRMPPQMLHQREMVENAAWSNPGALSRWKKSELEPELAVSFTIFCWHFAMS